jgi:zinc transport system permease protein
MLDDFFIRAIVAGIGVAAVTGPLGCFIVWRRLAYFGDTLAHAALLGVAIALLLEVNVTLAVFAVSAIIAVLLVWLQRRATLSSDVLLGLLSHASLALGLVALAFMTWVRFDLMALLFGDILAVSKTDIAVIYSGGIAVLAALYVIWKPLFAMTVSPEIAAAETAHPERASLVFTLLLAAVVAMAIKIVGVLLITALLIIPAAAARRLATGPEVMALLAALAGIASVAAGLFASLRFDTPSGPSIVVAALVIFVIALSPAAGLFIRRRERPAR